MSAVTLLTLWNGRKEHEISLVPSEKSREFLDTASMTYYEALAGSPAQKYLEGRGVSGVSAQFFRLGYVKDPLPGHDLYVGRLAIPYVTPSGVVTMRFRCIEHEDCKPIHNDKYRSISGDGTPRIFNTRDLTRNEPYVVITEGEMDAVIAHQAGIPAVAIPGTAGWRTDSKTPMHLCFRGYDVVFVLADSDDKGQGLTFAQDVAKTVRNGRVVPMPDGHDVNSWVLADGEDALRTKLGLGTREEATNG